ncbi:N-acetylglucosamine 6-phosphate deacetylase [Rubrobacter xylanophilus DSM 9941]|uniref:N-acetylglucosamine 6-phosphate deacetylase n=1 Tax=Rubrobacter xylanophilus (strain DSM 9941 / JCM 11954 / NBRC 16129 / PRD-1) TaxID=266117 RepID=Q1AYA0_RUBXD|nr:N-acetylglucosamine-6-phosphate deacetylase [Rubrobacter xylanophilus]ABG03628.1 N-acetylglucosamine 6-phosphate deacetylase [Rubrobacter xylanophilus DSM 9941]
MSLVALKGRVVTDYEVWEEGCVLLGDGAVRDVSRDWRAAEEADEVHELGESLILPGFVDLQVNGAFGVDLAGEPERLGELSGRLLSTGTTAYLPTVITSPPEAYERALPHLAGGIAAEPGGARPLGVHLEGPFISPGRRGAHPAEHVRPPDPGLLGRLLELAPVRMITVAPELPGADGLMAAARDRGAVVSLGHSDAPFEVAYVALDRYAAGVTHLFNAMSPLHHRDPGLPGAAFAHPRAVCGLIADGRHVHPEMVALAFRMLGPDRLCLVTDAISAAGMEAGEFTLASRRVRLEGGVPRLDDGTIAGSVLTMERAFQNILAFTGCTLPEAARMAAATPARLVGEGRRKGRLSPGYDADVTVLAPDLSVEAVWVGGRQLYSAGKVV